MNFYNVRALLLQRVGPPSEDVFEEWYRHPNWGPCSMCGSESGGPAVVAEVALDVPGALWPHVQPLKEIKMPTAEVNM